MSELLKAALAYAARSWQVFPLHSPASGGVCSCGRPDCGSPGKHPRTAHGLLDATIDHATSTGWWRRWPNANIGIASGVGSGLIVLDVDPRHGGDATLAELEACYGPLPPTVEALTGGGGRHVYFEHPGGVVRSAIIGPGLDLKADGGYVVAPPSLHVSGHRYEWDASAHPDDAPLSPVPDWLLTLTAKRRSDGPKAAGADGAIRAGQRNATLASLAGTMRRRGMSEEAILAALLAENAARCEPPLEEAEVLNIAASIARREPAGGKGEGGGEEPKRKSQGTYLVELAAAAELFHAPEKEACVTVPVGSHQENYRLGSKAFKDWLSRRFYEAQGTTPNSQALQDALSVLSGRAQFDGPEHPTFVRLAEHNGSIYLDLGGPAWEAAEVTPTGWRLVTDPPVKFIRPRGVLPLPTPVRGGDLEELRPFLNLASEEDWRLLVAWLLAAFRPSGPYPTLVLHGEQGSAKSTTARVLRHLIDPNRSDLRAEPREGRDLMIAATNGWVVALDNLSHLPIWLSDSLSRLATGGGFATRALYTDSEEMLFDAQRPVILNGIEELAARPDLLDRALVLYLPTLPEESRRSEAEFWHAFELAKPRILGALLDGVSVALRNFPHTRLERLPRMADFSLWATAAEPALGWPKGSFMAAYTGNRSQANDLALEASPVAAAVQSLEAQDGWSGTATELLGELDTLVGEEGRRRQGWPKSPKALANELRRIVPNLRVVGVEVSFTTPHGKRLIAIRRVGKNIVPSVPSFQMATNETQSGTQNAQPSRGPQLQTERWNERNAKTPTFSSPQEFCFCGAGGYVFTPEGKAFCREHAPELAEVAESW